MVTDILMLLLVLKIMIMVLPKMDRSLFITEMEVTDYRQRSDNTNPEQQTFCIQEGGQNCRSGWEIKYFAKSPFGRADGKLVLNQEQMVLLSVVIQ